MSGMFQRYLNLRNAFRACFQNGYWRDGEELTPQAERVFNELREFCRADTPCVQFDKDGKYDTHATAILQGRREVWLRLTSYINITDAELLKIKELGNE